VVSRIIAGAAGSLSLKVPQGATRPTSERVREAIFSSLEHRIDFEGIGVLDLFAGSGGLGFEALSRGATSLIAIDQDKKAHQALQANASTITKALGAPVTITTQCQPVSAFLANPDSLSGIQLVFIDPPYELPNETISEIVARLAELVDDALVVVERATKTGEPTWPEGTEVLSDKTYGDTRVFTLELSR
jgi:16S rRNA (guanine966-N2)-methyltransferase